MHALSTQQLITVILLTQLICILLIVHDYDSVHYLLKFFESQFSL